MIDVVTTTTTTLHLGSAELLTLLALLGSRWVWRSRHGLARLPGNLRRQVLSRSRQKVAGWLPSPSGPSPLPQPQEAPRRPL